MENNINVLIVDDHVVLAQGVQSMLEHANNVTVVGLAHTGERAVEIFKSLKPDIVLLDINLPDIDGMMVCEQIIETHIPCGILALSMHEEEAFITGMIEKGASGFLFKNVGQSELLEAIVSVHKGERYFSKAVTQTLVNTLVSQNTKRAANTPLELIEISQREKEVLKLIVAEQTTSEIAQQLHISQNTVQTHRRHLLEKVGARNVAGLVRIAIENRLLD